MPGFIGLTLYCKTPTGAHSECVFAITAPERHGRDFECIATVKGLDLDQQLPSYGVDPIQALLLSIQAIVSLVQRAERNGWQFFLSADRSAEAGYSCEVWIASSKAIGLN